MTESVGIAIHPSLPGKSSPPLARICRSWLKVTANNDAAHELMLADLVAAKVANRSVNLFENSGTIDISLVY